MSLHPIGTFAMSEKYRNGSMMQTMTDYMDDTAGTGLNLNLFSMHSFFAFQTISIITSQLNQHIPEL
jgi:hypothetical protein